MKLNYCIECAEPLAHITDTEYRCKNGHEYWNNPHATADVALINQDGQILVSKRAREPGKGTYDLPGGFLEYGEGSLEAAVREIKEETGLDLNPADLELVFSCPGFYHENESLVTNIYFARHKGGEPVAADDSEALEWQPLEFLDSPVCAPCYRGLREVLESKL